jgi:hypothetical protein
MRWSQSLAAVLSRSGFHEKVQDACRKPSLISLIHSCDSLTLRASRLCHGLPVRSILVRRVHRTTNARDDRAHLFLILLGLISFTPVQFTATCAAVPSTRRPPSSPCSRGAILSTTQQNISTPGQPTSFFANPTPCSSFVNEVRDATAQTSFAKATAVRQASIWQGRRRCS